MWLPPTGEVSTGRCSGQCGVFAQSKVRVRVRVRVKVRVRVIVRVKVRVRVIVRVSKIEIDF